MKKLYSVLIALFTTTMAIAQTTIANFDFNSMSSYPTSATTTASNITASVNSAETYTAYAGVATGSGAFVQNTTDGNALSMTNSSGTNTRYWTLTLGGSDLNKYINYKIYFQSEHSSTGATVITISYSTNGSSFTALSQTVAPGTNPSFTESIIDLSSISGLNNQTAVYIRFAASGASGTGTLRLDNLEIQAATSPWTMSGGNVNFTGGITATTFTTSGDAKVTGAFNSGATTVASLTNSGNLNVAGSSTLAAVTTSALTSGATTVSSLTNSGNLNVTGTTTLTGVVTTNTLNAAHLNISGSTSFSDINATATITSPKFITHRIIAPDTNGIHFGDSSVVLAYPSPIRGNSVTGNNVQFDQLYSSLGGPSGGRLAIGAAWALGNPSIAIGTNSANPTKANGANSIAIGMSGTEADAQGSTAIGYNVKVGSNATKSFAIGSGIGISNSTALVNNTPNSLAVGFNSNFPTLFVTGGNGTANSVGNVGIGYAPGNFGNLNNNPTPYKTLTVYGDVSLANYVGVPGSGHNPLDGLNGTEVLGGDKVPTRRGISTDDDPTGDMNFFINTNDNTGTTEFHFKNGAKPDYSYYSSATVAPSLMTINSNGEVIIPKLTPTGSTANQLNTVLVDHTGKLVYGATLGASGSSWVLGGNTLGGAAFPNNAFGTTDDDLVFISGGTNAGNERMRILKTGGIKLSNHSGIIQCGGSNAGITTTDDMGLYSLRNSYYMRFVTDSGSFVFFTNVADGTGVNSNATPAFSIDSYGNAAINSTSSTTSPLVIKGTANFSGDNKLFEVKANGKIYSREIFVQTSAFPDYVFRKDYSLMSLAAVEKFIAQNQHLPNIPSAKEVETEGQNLGVIQVKQMEKIEEIYLYMIEMNKKMQALEEENKRLSNEVKSLKK